MTNGPDEFHDPALKAAIQRVLGGHVVSPELRDRVTASLNAEAAKGESPANESRWQIRRVVTWAVAACLVLGLAGRWYYQKTADEARAQQAYLDSNRALVNKMIAVGASEPAGPLVLAVMPQSKLAEVKDQVAKELGRAVPTPDLAAVGWTLASAAVVPFDTVRAARFDFTHGPQRAMLISLPAAQFYGTDKGDTYQFVANGHPVAGYVKDGILNCIVGNTGVSLSDAITLRDQIRKF